MGAFATNVYMNFFCYFWAGEFTPKKAPTFSETPCIVYRRHVPGCACLLDLYWRGEEGGI
jgi:hypothetical protein